MSFYALADIFFFGFHTLFILFNIVGWAIKGWRKFHLITVGLTAFSWFVLGIWYGWGYCFCTDWHWDVRRKLGYNDSTNSYIEFLLEKLTGIDFQASLVDTATVIVFVVCLFLSVYFNIRDYRQSKRPI